MLARAPRWSQALTSRMSNAIPADWEGRALTAIRAVHTLIFASVGAAVARVLWDGLRGRPSRATAIAVGVALGETAVFVSNNSVCPLTPLAHELGAERGSVADIFLPGWFARRIPLLAGSALLIGLVLNVRAVLYATEPEGLGRSARLGSVGGTDVAAGTMIPRFRRAIR